MRHSTNKIALRLLAVAASIALCGCVGGYPGSVPATPAQQITDSIPLIDDTNEAPSPPMIHRLAAGRSTTLTGATVEHDDVAVSCPLDDDDCVVESAFVTWTVPENHGLAAGRFTIQPGVTDVHGNVAVSCPVGGDACVVEVLADGSASYAQTGGTPSVILAMPEKLPELPLQRLVHAAHVPIVDPLVEPDGNLHVGADAAPGGATLTSIETHSGVAISSGRVQDGVGAARVLDFLGTPVSGGPFMAGTAYTTFGRGTTGLATFPDRPIVRLAKGTSEEYAAYAVRAVQLINAALPYDKRILLSKDPAPALAAIKDVPDGEIFVDFAATHEDWNLPYDTNPSYVAAIAEPDENAEYNFDTHRWESKGMRAGHVWFSVEALLNQAWVLNPATRYYELRLLDTPVVESDTVLLVNTEEAILSVMVHELLHVLGFVGHNNAAYFPDSTMRHNLVLHIDHLPGIDGEALFAAYNRFGPGTLPEDLSAENLGEWDDTSFHMRGDVEFASGSAAFGVASRNGLARPWAFGPKPWTDLADNPILSGAAMWSGRLLGFTPALEPVGGAAELTVQLETLDGQLDFTHLEHWEANAEPGPTGSGAIWADGDLQYLLNIHGNTFVQTGGDEGTVTGAFFGPVHEAMGGVLERMDMIAAFGGKR